MAYVSDLLGTRTLFGSGGDIPVQPYERKAIHITDLQTYCVCRRQWNWSSMLREGLQPAMLSSPLFIGQAVHKALEAGYSDSVGGPMKFDTVGALQFFSEWVAGVEDKARSYTGPMWESYREQVNEDIWMVQVLLAHYGRWVESIDERWDLMGTEQMFSVPIPHSRLKYDGRFDGLVKDRLTDRIYILEFKTAKSVSSSWLSGVFRSMQGAAYTWAARQIFGDDVVGVLYRVMRKKVPDSPRKLKNGYFSSAQSQQLTPHWLEACLDAMADSEFDTAEDPPPWSQIRKGLDDRAAALRSMLLAKDNEFQLQKVMVKTSIQIEETMRAVKTIGSEMADPHTPCPPMAGYHCGWCKFQSPCDLLVHGESKAARAVLEAEYAPRTYWEQETEES